MRYKVLWIDDEYKKQLDFIGEAEQDGIDLVPFESHEEGIADLNTKLDYYHAVILDAKVKKSKTDTITGLAGLTASRDRLVEINNSVYLPYFIFTGQPDYANSNWFKEAYQQYYIKSLDNDKLFRDLKEAIEKKKEYQVQKKYQKVFEVCSEKYIGEASLKHLLDILINSEYPSNKFDDEKYFNGLRKVIEYVFRASNKLGLLHDKCIPNGIINLTWASLFMSGNEFELKPSHEKIGCSKIHFPSILGRNVKSVLDITSAASHTEEERRTGKLNFSEYKKNINSNYLLYSLAFQVMDLIMWFKGYADENSDIEINKSFWITLSETPNLEWHTGKVVNKNDGKGFAFFKPDNGLPNTFIPPIIVSVNSITNNDTVSVIIEEYEDLKSNERKTRVKDLKKII